MGRLQYKNPGAGRRENRVGLESQGIAYQFSTLGNLI